MINALKGYVQRYWGFIVLLVWGGVILGAGLVRFTNFHMDETSARALLLTWSLVQQIATPIPLAQLPDLRTLLMLPLAVYWPGSLMAAKVFSMLLTFCAAALIYRWSKLTATREVALIATALLLVCPLTIKQIDAVGTGPFLLLAFGLSPILDRRYRAGQRLVSGWYFSQILLATFAVSLHPAGLAYPLALAWSWFKAPIASRQRPLYIGLVAGPLFILIFQGGWVAPDWLSNPVTSLASFFSGAPTAMGHSSALLGFLLIFLLVVLVILDHAFLGTDFLGRLLLLALLVGLAAADNAWGMIALVIILFRGVHFLVLVNERLNRPGLLGERGIVLAGLFVFATAFMVADKTYAHVIATHRLSPQDQLIQDLARFAKAAELSEKKQVHVASQWPGRTMLVCKCYVLPLPPPAPDAKAFIKQIRGIDFLVFDHKDRANHKLIKEISMAGGATETVAVKSAGVIVKVRAQPAAGAAGKKGATGPTDE